MVELDRALLDKGWPRSKALSHSPRFLSIQPTALQTAPQTATKFASGLSVAEEVAEDEEDDEMGDRCWDEVMRESNQEVVTALLIYVSVSNNLTR